LLGRRRRRLLAAPALGLGLALSEAATLLSVVGLLLLLVEKHSHTTVHLLGVQLTLSFSQLAWVAVAGCVVSTAVRLVEARFTSAYQARAIEAATRQIVEAWFAADWERIRISRLGYL